MSGSSFHLTTAASAPVSARFSQFKSGQYSPSLSAEMRWLLATSHKYTFKTQFITDCPKASSKDVPYSYQHPPMTKKPQWYWRTLACLPYLMPLHETWMYAETAYNLHPFLEQFEFMTYPFLDVIGKLPPCFRW